jgi:multidrug efflux pump subunit AcrB
LIPVLFMPEIVGRLFREFGLTLVTAIMASALVALTLTPMMCGQLLKHRGSASQGRLSNFCERALARTVLGYERSLDWTLRYRWTTLTVAAALAMVSIGLYVHIPKGFLPTQDTGVMRVRTLARSHTSFEAMLQFQSSAAGVIEADPAVAHVASYIGNALIAHGTMLVSLKPPSVRKDAVDVVIARLRKKLAKLDGVRTILTPVQDLSVGAHRTAARYQYTLTALSRAELVRWAMIMVQQIRAMPQATDVVSNYETGGLGANLLVNRVRAGQAGVSVAEVDNVLYDWFGQRDVNTIRLETNFNRVVMEVDPRFNDNPSVLRDVFLIAGVPIDVLSRAGRAHAPMWVFHEDRLPGITISFNTPLGVSIGQALAAVKAAEAKVGLPNEVRASFRGEAREAEQASRTQPLLFLAALVAVYIILGMLYESYAHPFTILSTLPSAAFGALLALEATGTQFTVITAIACILLVGLVMKNAVMMIDFALDAQRGRGLSAGQAIREAASLRFRPIVMTTMAALLGALPLALGTGPGFELRQPLGIAVVGGLLLSQFVTLYTTPAVFLAIEALRSRRVRTV